jgi:hypothetical protein
MWVGEKEIREYLVGSPFNALAAHHFLIGRHCQKAPLDKDAVIAYNNGFPVQARLRTTPRSRIIKGVVGRLLRVELSFCPSYISIRFLVFSRPFHSKFSTSSVLFLSVSSSPSFLMLLRYWHVTHLLNCSRLRQPPLPLILFYLELTLPLPLSGRFFLLGLLLRLLGALLLLLLKPLLPRLQLKSKHGGAFFYSTSLSNSFW